MRGSILGTGFLWSVVAHLHGAPCMAAVFILMTLAFAWMTGQVRVHGILAVLVMAQVYAWWMLISPAVHVPGIHGPIAPTEVPLGAFAEGGLLGVGVGNGTWPETASPSFFGTFLFSVIGQELGTLGALGVMALFAAFGVLGFRLAGGVLDPFARFCVMGLTLALLVPVAGHVGVCLAVLPAGKCWLPFLNYGGPGLVAAWAAVGTIGSAVQYDVMCRAGSAMPGRLAVSSAPRCPRVRVRVVQACLVVFCGMLAFHVLWLSARQGFAPGETGTSTEPVPEETRERLFPFNEDHDVAPELTHPLLKRLPMEGRTEGIHVTTTSCYEGRYGVPCSASAPRPCEQGVPLARH